MSRVLTSYSTHNTVDHFEDESVQSSSCTGTDSQTHNNRKYTKTGCLQLWKTWKSQGICYSWKTRGIFVYKMLFFRAQSETHNKLTCCQQLITWLFSLILSIHSMSHERFVIRFLDKDTMMISFLDSCVRTYWVLLSCLYCHCCGLSVLH